MQLKQIKILNENVMEEDEIMNDKYQTHFTNLLAIIGNFIQFL